MPWNALCMSLCNVLFIIIIRLSSAQSRLELILFEVNYFTQTQNENSGPRITRELPNATDNRLLRFVPRLVSSKGRGITAPTAFLGGHSQRSRLLFCCNLINSLACGIHASRSAVMASHSRSDEDDSGWKRQKTDILQAIVFEENVEPRIEDATSKEREGILFCGTSGYQYKHWRKGSSMFEFCKICKIFSPH
jgi:hypothetical protein